MSTRRDVCEVRSAYGVCVCICAHMLLNALHTCVLICHGGLRRDHCP